MNRKSCAENHFGLWLAEPHWMQEAANAVRSGLWTPVAQDNDEQYDCECIDCGHRFSSDEHCRNVECPECGGECRRAERPGPGQRTSDDDNSHYVLDQNGIATIPISGHMVKHRSSFGGTSTVEARRAVVEADNDPNVRGIMLLIDSPGGSVAGTFDLAHSVSETDTPIHTYAQDMMASAALLVGSQADHVSGNYNANIGSIGVVSQVADYSGAYEAAGIQVHTISTGKYKGAFAEGSEITDEQLEYLQERVDRIHDLFVDAMVSGREMTEEYVREISTGEVWIGEDAVEAGLADVIEPMDAAYERLEAAIGGKVTVKFSIEEEPMFGKSKGKDEAADGQTEYERLDGIEDALAEFGDHTSDLALRCFRCGIEPDQAREIAHGIEKVLEAELADAEDVEAELSELREELSDARDTIEAKDEELDGLKERLADGNEAVEEATASPEDTDVVRLAEQMADEEDIPFSEAMSRVAREHPDEYEQYRQSR